MANNKVDRDVEYMKKTFGTTCLVTDYRPMQEGTKKFMREIAHDNMNPKLQHFKKQNELHQQIRNDDDYDDWEYGSEPEFFNSALNG